MVREKRVETIYAKLRESALRGSNSGEFFDFSVASSPLLIFASTSDVDSLCALKVIFHILLVVVEGGEREGEGEKMDFFFPLSATSDATWCLG